MLRRVFLILISAAGIARASSWPDLSRQASEQGGGKDDAAVVVGVERYAFVPAVPGAARNADDWFTYLTKTRAVPVERMRLLRDSEATLEELRSELGWAAQNVKPGGTLWFVFIGHGAAHKDGKDGVLVGVDAQQRAASLYARSLRQSEALQILGQGPQSRTVVVLDTCFSGRTPEGKELVAGLQPLVLAAPLAPKAGTALFTAGRSDQFAGPLPGAERPAFSYLLLGALRGWGDADKDGSVTASEAVAYARGALQSLLKDRRQTPELVGEAPGPLASRASETGPDLAALVRAARPQAASELSFGQASRVSVPQVKVKAAEGGFKDVNLAVERLLEEALLLERDAKATPYDRMEAWCLLAGHAERNPYLDKAKDACRRWEDFTDRRHEQELLLIEDYAALKGYLELRLKTPEQKLAAADAFLEAYAPLKENPKVSAARLARAALAAGEAASLPSPQPVKPPPARFSTINEIPETLKEEAFGPLTDPSFDKQQEACKAGQASGCADLGNASVNNYGSIRNIGRGAALFELACRLGKADACHAAAYHFKGQGAHARALNLYALGCVEHGNAEECRYLSNAISGSAALSKDYHRRGTLTMEAACLRGDMDACVSAGYQYNSGWSYNMALRDLPRARLLFGIACRAKSQEACYTRESIEQKLRELETFRAEVLGQASSTPSWESGCRGNQYCAKHLDDCRKSQSACGGLASAFSSGSYYGVGKSPEFASELNRLACDAGNARSCYYLAAYYARGETVPAKSAFQAFELYRKACELGEGGACQEAGKASENGLGTEASNDQALAFYRKGCASKQPHVCGDVARVLLNGSVEPNEAEAKMAALEACEAGSYSACAIAVSQFSDEGARKKLQELCAKYDRPECAALK